MSFNPNDLKRKCEICGKHKGRSGNGKIISHEACSKEKQRLSLEKPKKHKRSKTLSTAKQIVVANIIKWE